MKQVKYLAKSQTKPVASKQSPLESWRERCKTLTPQDVINYALKNLKDYRD